MIIRACVLHITSCVQADVARSPLAEATVPEKAKNLPSGVSSDPPRRDRLLASIAGRV